MLLSSQSTVCIWCGEVLSANNRSEEHIIPQCLGGRLCSPDVCRSCNNRFGAESDHKLLRDERIYHAAMEAGINHDEFLRRHDVVATTGSGREVRLTVRDGVSRPVGGLGAPHPYIGADAAGNFSPQEIRNLRGRLKVKAKQNKPFQAEELVGAEVDKLVDTLLAGNGAQTVYSSIIEEGLAVTMTGDTVKMTTTYHPVDTQRAMAKSLFTIAKNVVPLSLHSVIGGCLDEVFKFARDLPDAQPVIHEDRTAGAATKVHSLSVSIGGSTFHLEAVLFGILRWWVECEINCDGNLANLPHFFWNSLDDLDQQQVNAETTPPV